MGYVAWSVVFGEQPSASKWNILGVNDASFNDGTGIADDKILARHVADGVLDNTHMANRTREVQIGLFADDAGGAVSSHTMGMPAVNFSGTPSSYARMSGVIPADYVSGTDIVLRLKLYASNNGTHSHVRYVNCDAAGDSLASLWDIDSAVTVTGEAFTANILKNVDITVAAANIAAGSLFSAAWRISTAITGNIWLEAASIRYTADM